MTNTSADDARILGGGTYVHGVFLPRKPLPRIFLMTAGAYRCYEWPSIPPWLAAAALNSSRSAHDLNIALELLQEREDARRDGVWPAPERNIKHGLDQAANKDESPAHKRSELELDEDTDIDEGSDTDEIPTPERTIKRGIKSVAPERNKHVLDKIDADETLTSENSNKHGLAQTTDDKNSSVRKEQARDSGKPSFPKLPTAPTFIYETKPSDCAAKFVDRSDPLTIPSATNTPQTRKITDFTKAFYGTSETTEVPVAAAIPKPPTQQQRYWVRIRTHADAFIDRQTKVEFTKILDEYEKQAREYLEQKRIVVSRSRLSGRDSPGMKRKRPSIRAPLFENDSEKLEGDEEEDSEEDSGDNESEKLGGSEGEIFENTDIKELGESGRGELDGSGSEEAVEKYGLGA